MTSTATPARRGRSALAVIGGFLAVFVLSLGTDVILHGLQVYPPWTQPMSGGLFALALGYRLLYTVFGGYLTARLAPARPMFHVVVLAGVGLVAGIAGVVVAVRSPQLGPLWYPVALAVLSVPCVWVGGRLLVARGNGR